MKNLQSIVFGLLTFALLTGAADAQRRKTTRKPAAKKPVATKVVVPPLEVRVAREKVDNQLANVNKFIDVLGPIALGIEQLDQQAKARPLARAAADTNEANKQKVVEAIRNLKAGLATLESDFRIKPDLKKYLLTIQGITDLAAQSEDSALAGKFVAAKEPLRAVAKKLTDTLAALPMSPPQ